MTGRAALLVSGALVLTGCSGPQVPLEIGAKAVSVNVEFGKPELIVPPDVAPPPVEVQPLEGGVAILAPGKAAPVPIRSIPAPVAREPCPAASPFAFPAEEATNQVFTSAPAGRYEFRASGTVERAGAKTAYPDKVVRTVAGVRSNPDGSRQFDVSEKVFGITSTTTYRTDATQVAIAQITRTDRSGTVVFGFVPPLKILPLPPRSADPAGRPVDTWQAAATDPDGGASITIDGKVAGRERVDACGEVIDSWVADATQRVVGPNEDLTSTMRTRFATQYGGLIVASHVTTTGRIGNDAYRSEVAVTISSVPGD